MKQNNPKSPYTKCRGCGKRILLSLFKYCPDCAILANRLYQEHFSPKAKKGFWAYLRKHGKRCCFSGMSLEIDDDTSPWYLVFSRLNPGDKSKIAPRVGAFECDEIIPFEKRIPVLRACPGRSQGKTFKGQKNTAGALAWA